MSEELRKLRDDVVDKMVLNAERCGHEAEYAKARVALLAALDREKDAKPYPTDADTVFIPPGPKAEERTVEELLESLSKRLRHSGWEHRNEWADEANDALRLVRELRTDRDEWEKAYMEAMRRGDELKRRIEAALNSETQNYGNTIVARILRGDK